MSEYGVSDEVIENCEEKLGKSPCLTSVSSFSGSDKPGENEEAVGENKFDLSSVDSNSNYWDKVREEIMRWF